MGETHFSEYFDIAHIWRDFELERDETTVKFDVMSQYTSPRLNIV